MRMPLALLRRFRCHSRDGSGTAGARDRAVTIPQARDDAVVVDRDEHPPRDTIEKLAALPHAFPERGIGEGWQCLCVKDRCRGLIIALCDAVKKYG